MPSSGKSTVGRMVAKELGIPFIDTDSLITEKTNRELQTIINEDGYDAFADIEREVLLTLNIQEPSVIATGGSAVLYDDAMKHLKEIGTVVFLDVELPTIRKRLNNLDTRGVVVPQSDDNDVIKELYRQREPLYYKYCDVRFPSDNMGLRTLVSQISELYR